MTDGNIGEKGYDNYGVTRQKNTQDVLYGNRQFLPRNRVAGDTMGRLFRYLFRVWSPRCERYLAWPRNTFYAGMLNAANISLGARNRIRGIANIKVGRNFKALDHLWLEAVEHDRIGNNYRPSIVIGDDVVFGYCVHVAATNHVRIGNDVLVGSRVIITDHNHGIYRGEAQSSPLKRPADRLLTSDAETVVEDNVWIGDGVVILPGAHIGKGSIVGANSIVNDVLPEYCMAAGSPARPIRIYDFDSKSWLRKDEKPVEVIQPSAG